MSRPQFTLRALLLAMLVVAAFFGGAKWQQQRDQRRLLQPDDQLLWHERLRETQERQYQRNARAMLDEIDRLREK